MSDASRTYPHSSTPLVSSFVSSSEMGRKQRCCQVVRAVWKKTCTLSLIAVIAENAIILRKMYIILKIVVTASWLIFECDRIQLLRTFGTHSVGQHLQQKSSSSYRISVPQTFKLLRCMNVQNTNKQHVNVQNSVLLQLNNPSDGPLRKLNQQRPIFANHALQRACVDLVRLDPFRQYLGLISCSLNCRFKCKKVTLQYD